MQKHVEEKKNYCGMCRGVHPVFSGRKIMKKGQVLTGIVKRVDFPNKGIVETEEGICIVKNVLPGQKVTFAVQKKRNGRGEG